MTRKLNTVISRNYRLFGVSVFLGVAMLALCVQTASASDDDIVNAMGFEPGSPPNGFSTTYLGTGQLEGQVNPPGSGQVISPGQWLRTKGAGTSTAVVESTVFAPGGGTQAVRVNRAANANADQRWAVPVNALAYPDYPNPPPGQDPQPCICITWDMRVEHSLANGDTTFGPFFGVESYDDDGNPVALLGSLGVDAGTGEVLYQAAGTGFLTPTGSVVSYGQWNRFQMKLDYSTHQYSVLLNGSMLGTIGFVDQNNVVGGLNEFSDADIAGLAAAGDPLSQAMPGTAYYDNFLVREGTCTTVPEPASIMLSSLAFVWVASRRRRATQR